MDKKQIASMIDHTILRADASKDDVSRLCQEALRHNFASVCVNPCHVVTAAAFLRGSDVAVCTVIGFPLGANTSESKAFEARNAVKNGASEVDMVINIGALKSRNDELVEADIRAVVTAAKTSTTNGRKILVKVIIETALLTDEEKRRICEIILRTDADFVKTSTGFSTGGASESDIVLFRSIMQSNKYIKASGGIRTLADLLRMREQGADRIGTSAGVSIMQELNN